MSAPRPMAPGRVVTGGILRGLLLTAVGYAVLLLVEALSGPSVGANIGAGIAALFAPPIVAFVWSLVDGRADRWGALWVWALAAVVAGVAEAIRQSDPSGFVFIAAATCVASAVGVAIGTALAQPSRRSG